MSAAAHSGGHWAVPYLGKPWRVGAAGPEDYDCWGLVRAVYQAQCGLVLPAAGFAREDVRGVLAAFRDHPERGNWALVDGAAADLDAVLMAHGRYPVHVGIYLAADGGRVLHAQRPRVVAQDLVSLAAHGYRIHGIYRHAPRAG